MNQVAIMRVVLLSIDLRTSPVDDDVFRKAPAEWSSECPFKGAPDLLWTTGLVQPRVMGMERLYWRSPQSIIGLTAHSFQFRDHVVEGVPAVVMGTFVDSPPADFLLNLRGLAGDRSHPLRRFGQKLRAEMEKAGHIEIPPDFEGSHFLLVLQPAIGRPSLDLDGVSRVAHLAQEVAPVVSPQPEWLHAVVPSIFERAVVSCRGLWPFQGEEVVLALHDDQDEDYKDRMTLPCSAGTLLRLKLAHLWSQNAIRPGRRRVVWTAAEDARQPVSPSVLEAAEAALVERDSLVQWLTNRRSEHRSLNRWLVMQEVSFRSAVAPPVSSLVPEGMPIGGEFAPLALETVQKDMEKADGAMAIRDSDSRARIEILSTRANYEVAAENLRLQRTVAALTKWAIAFTVIMLLVSLLLAIDSPTLRDLLGLQERGHP